MTYQDLEFARKEIQNHISRIQEYPLDEISILSATKMISEIVETTFSWLTTQMEIDHEC